MDVGSLHSPVVRRAIQTINEGRLDEFLALFAPDATVVDGATYHESEAIRDWAERETFGVRMHIDVAGRQSRGNDSRGECSLDRRVFRAPFSLPFGVT